MKTKILFYCIFALCILSGCSRDGSEPKDNTSNNGGEDTSTPRFVIDAHVHYRPTDEWEKSFVEVYTRHNAMGCVMVKMEDLERGIQFAKAHPDRVIPYAMIEIDNPTVLEDVRKVHAIGYKGLGEFFARNEWNYDDIKYEPLWTLAEQLGMPLAPHTGNLSNGMMARLRPAYLATMQQNIRS
jgi:predicted TIM-barrel fold metal-dependent hydrolase